MPPSSLHDDSKRPERAYNTIWTTYCQGAVSGLQEVLRALIDDRVAAHYSTIRSSRVGDDQLFGEERRGMAYGSPANSCGYPIRQ